MKKAIFKRLVCLAVCLLLAWHGGISAVLAAAPEPDEGFAELASTDQVEPEKTVKEIGAKAVDEHDNEIDTTVEEYTFTFSTIPTCYEDIVQYKLDSPYKTMALLILAFKTCESGDYTACMEMLDYLTDTRATLNGEPCPFSQYIPWRSILKDRMDQNNKYKYIGNAYLKGATPENNYTPDEPITITLRQSVYEPYAEAVYTTDGKTQVTPKLYQVLISLAGADNDRYCLFYQDDEENWKVWSTNWQNLLVDVQTQASDILTPPEYARPANPAHPQPAPTETVTLVPALAAGVDENGDTTVIDTTVEEHTFTFSTIPTCYEDIVQYELDSPYKTMALLILAFKACENGDYTACAEMLDYLTNTAVPEPGKKDAEEHQLCYPFSRYYPWISFLKDRMDQNNKYAYIGNAYLNGATPENNYTPNTPVTITLRQSTYEPYTSGTHLTDPTLYQVLISLDGADNDRYCLLYQDQRGDWRIWSTSWQSLLVDVQTRACDILTPPEYTRPTNPAHPQLEPVEVVYEVPAQAPGVDDGGNATILDVTVEQHSFTFLTVPTCYEDIVQYKLDSPYKTMALLILAFRTWTPENPSVCLEMLDYLTNTAVDSGKTDSQGNKLSKRLSEHQFWVDFVRDRMRQNNKYRYIGNAYLEGATPSNDYTPTEPITITVRQSVYDPYHSSDTHLTDPTLKQVLISLAGADNDRYSLFYQDQRGDWRVFGDNWKGLLTDVKTPTEDIPWPAEVDRSKPPVTPQADPTPVVEDVPARAVDENDEPFDTTVKQYTFTFSTIPTCYEDIVQYELDSPYKTMALLILAFKA